MDHYSVYENEIVRCMCVVVVVVGGVPTKQLEAIISYWNVLEWIVSVINFPYKSKLRREEVG